MRAHQRRAIGVVAGMQLLSCGGGPKPPPCQTADCTLPGRTTVTVTLDHYPELLFDGDTCLDLGVVTLHAEAVGIDDPSQFAEQDVACGQGQVTFLGLAPGNYTFSITALDDGGNPIIKAPVTAMSPAGVTGADVALSINVPFDAWTNTYTGTFLFRLSWAGMSCADAAPPIKQQILTLVAGGVVTTATTDTNQKLDGNDPEPCRPLTEQFAQFVLALPFGPASLHVVGKDASGMARFDHQFATFIGAAKNNPTITFDVPPPDAAVDAAVPDAPVDAPPDGP